MVVVQTSSCSSHLPMRWFWSITALLACFILLVTVFPSLNKKIVTMETPLSSETRTNQQLAQHSLPYRFVEQIESGKEGPVKTCWIQDMSIKQDDVAVGGTKQIDKNKKLSIHKTLDLLARSPAFRDEMLKLLQTGSDIESDGYFWECVPFSQTSWDDEPFAMKLVATSNFKGMYPDVHAFKDYFSKDIDNKGVVEFPNLSGDTQLIVPIPLKNMYIAIYTHAASFFRAIHMHDIPTVDKQRLHAQQSMLLQQTALAALDRASIQDIVCISTSGLGVAYLHIRIASWPKYYVSEEYIRIYKSMIKPF